MEEVKDDKHKLRLSLTPTQIIKDIAEARQFGVDKYKNVDRWKNIEMQRWVDALYRHFLEFLEDPSSKDDESGLEHYKHMACNMAFICEAMKISQKLHTL